MKRSELARARRRLWRATFTIIGALVAAVLLLSAEPPAGTLPDYLPSRRVLGLALIATAATFLGYAIASERRFARLTDHLFTERAERLLLADHEAEQRDFISLTAHELRTPLTVIKGYVSTLVMRDEAINADRRSRYLQIVNEQTDRLAGLVEDLMEVSRIEAGRLSLACEPLDLPTVLASLTEANARRWDDRVTLDLTDVPQVSGDQRRVEAIVLNLVDNAVKYSRSEVTLRLGTDGEAVEIAVADRGNGIASEDVPRLFEKFHRLPDAVAGDVPGTGLGLYIVRALTEAHGGTISVDSTQGRGTTFTVRLPAARALSVPA